MKDKEALAYIGGLSQPSKMPWYAYSLPATACKTGSKLAEIEGSVCHDCYALKGYYNFPVVKSALARRLASLENLDLWAEAMVKVIKYKSRYIPKEKHYFRWHDSGDIQSVDHLRAIAWIAIWLPDIQF